MSENLAVPPGPPVRYPGQHLLAFRRDPILFLRRIARDYGDIAAIRIGSDPVHLVSHPDLIRDVLVTQARSFHKSRGLERAKKLLGEGLLTSEDEFHRRQRRLVQPAFHRERIAEYATRMVEDADRTRRRWSDGATVDVSAEMLRLTLAIVGKTLFNSDVEADTAQISASITEVIQLFHLLMLPYAELLERLPLPAVRRFRRSRARLDAIIYGFIADHRAAGTDQGDLLSMLLAAQDEEAHGNAMPDKQVRDEAMTIFIAGHETTANALAWTWYLLSQHPDIEAGFHAEIDAALSQETLPTLDELPRLAYTRRIIAESMRLYPPAWVIGRRAVASVTVGGYMLPAGSIVLLSQAVTHVDPRWFPDPLHFDPDRWLPSAEAERPKFSYFPFGGGPRTCIGEQFAWMELVLVLATIGRHWRMRLDPGQLIATQPIITLRPRYGMKMRLERR